MTGPGGSPAVDASYYGLIEIVLTLGGVLAFGIWQLRSTARDQAATRAREGAERRDAPQGDSRRSDPTAR